MQCIKEPSMSYKDISTLRQDLAIMDVKETPTFQIKDMLLTTKGDLEVKGIGEFSLTEIALKDALQRGGLHRTSCDNFFAEDKEVLNQAIVDAANTFYQHSRYATNEIKLITRAGDNEPRIVLGIPSARYTLLSHEEAIEKIIPAIKPELKLARANLYPEYLELAFTDPINTTKDAVGEIVQIGCKFLNSQGTRTRSLVAAAFSYRLVCTNGATAKNNMFSVQYPHKGNILSNGDLEHKVVDICERFAVMMHELPKLGKIPVTKKFIQEIRPELTQSIGSKESNDFLARIDCETETVNDIWNKITNLPHNIEKAETKLKLEQLGFRILTMHLAN